MAINKVGISISGIKAFLDLFKDPNAGWNAFQAAVNERLGSGMPDQTRGLAGPADVAAGVQAGPTVAAAERQAAMPAAAAPTGVDRRRAILETIMANPALIADLPKDQFDRFMGASEGLAEMEAGPEPSPELQRLKEFQGMFPNQPITPQMAGGALNVLPDPTGDMIELEAINAARRAQNKPEYGMEEGLRLLANMHTPAGTSVTVSPVLDLGVGDFLAKFTEKQEGTDRRERLSMLEPTIAQLKQAKAVLATPGVMTFLATSGPGRTVGAGLATFQSLTGKRPFADFDANTLGATQAALDTGIRMAASTLARLSEKDISEPTRKRMEELAQVGSFLSNPAQAAGAIDEILRVMESLQTQAGRELTEGGVRLNTEAPVPEAPNRPAARIAIRAKIKELLKANPSKYPGGEKDPQLLLDAVQAVDREAKLPVPGAQE